LIKIIADSTCDLSDEILKKYNIELYLWLPIFSEMDYFTDMQEVITWQDQKLPNYNLQEGEKFNFFCPGNKQNIENILSIIKSYYIKDYYDGIFLDKIRYPSFSNGKDAVFTCFCDDCKKGMKKAGIDIEKLKDSISNNFIDNINESGNPFNIKNYSNLNYNIADRNIRLFFKFKQKEIEKSLTKIHVLLKENNLKVGYDLLAPFLGYFSGQNIVVLSKKADFIKPMYYRKTKAPAGIIYELENYFKNFSNNDENIYLKLINNTEIILNFKYNYEEFDLNFVVKELENIETLNTSLIPGIEVNRLNKIAPITPNYIKESLEGITKVIKNEVLLSWDCMSIPEDNLDVLLN